MDGPTATMDLMSVTASQPVVINWNSTALSSLEWNTSLMVDQFTTGWLLKVNSNLFPFLVHLKTNMFLSHTKTRHGISDPSPVTTLLMFSQFLEKFVPSKLKNHGTNGINTAGSNHAAIRSAWTMLRLQEKAGLVRKILARTAASVRTTVMNSRAVAPQVTMGHVVNTNRLFARQNHV